MARFLIEVPHEAELAACARAIKILLEKGSHFLTQADFGCEDGVHKAWVIVDVDSRAEALNLLPPFYRPHATVIALRKFSLDEIDSILSHHEQELPEQL